ncbi:hypothetical protein MJM28_30345, partial [Salmonella enterica subsp. enterica serovar Montevideo]|nr:hypothetical protein [Salmonella enterica subsp. enterica serovar Montevideo]
APVPTLSPLRAESVSIMTDAVRQDRLSIMWDTPWQPIRESAAPEVEEEYESDEDDTVDEERVERRPRKRKKAAHKPASRQYMMM